MIPPTRWIVVPAALAGATLTLAARVGLRAARETQRDRNREIARIRAWENEGGALAADTPGS